MDESSTGTAPLLVLGLGNDLVSDDGFGPAVAEAVRRGGDVPKSVEVVSAAVAGFHLLDILRGRRRALLIDVVQTGRSEPGTLSVWPVASSGAARTLGGSHQMDLATTLELGHRLGQEMPESVTVLVAEAKDLLTVREELTPALAAAVDAAVPLVRRWIETGSVEEGASREA
ncbi:MAG: hydrogenase maturation protease [Candidatus Eisenbacteria bacterium]|nr:hydrogenase maturation protease [Candidatus Latescibacterota bacterium]MBD3302571.1 hydrogenase maturation protease [Candidatus Eisenbacteria bacterium]